MLGNIHATAQMSQPQTLSKKCFVLLSAGSRGSSTAPNRALTIPGDKVTSVLHVPGKMLAGNGLPCPNYGTLQRAVMEAHEM